VGEVWREDESTYTFSMLNFKWLFEFLFKSFLVGRDVEMIERLYLEGYQSLLIIKRSWLYGLASSLWMIPLVIFGVVNVYLILKHFGGTPFGMVLAGFIALNIIVTVYSSLRYIWDFRKNYGGYERIIHTHDLLVRLKHGDNSFTRCFNQLQTNFVIFLIVIVIYIVHIFFIAAEIEFFYAALDVICILFQLFLIGRFIKLIIDLEMDFNIAVKWRMIFVDQNGMFSDINTIDADKIKNIRSMYPNFIASFFHFGTIEVLTEGDQELLWHNKIEFVDRPERTVENINAIISGKIALEEHIHNLYLQKILAKFSKLPAKDRKTAIKTYLTEYEEQIKKEYQNTQDPEIKRDIEEIYTEYYK